MPKATSFAEFEHAKKNAAKKAIKNGPVRHMTVEPAEMNGVKGYLTTAHHTPPKDSKKNGMGLMMDHDALVSKAFHKSAEDAGSHTSQMMGGKQMATPKAGDPDEDGD